MKKLLAISFIFFLIFGLFLSFQTILSQEDGDYYGDTDSDDVPSPEPEPEPTPVPIEDDDDECSPSMSTWIETEYDADEFKCENEKCGSDILKRERWMEYEYWDDGCGDSGYSFVGYTYTDPVVLQEIEPWQRCEPYQGSWEESVPDYGCQGDCIDVPKDPVYYDNPTYSNQPKKDIGDSDIKLPVKLDWKDVEGWDQGDESPQIYIINITTSTDKGFSKVLDESEYIPRACLFPSNKTSNWKVKACCGTDPEKCGEESDWSLSTDLSPELVSPYDPDWEGATSTKNVALPITLDWCDVEEAGSYRFRVYIIDDEEKTCHPNLLSIKDGEKICDSWLFEKKWVSFDQAEKELSSAFMDLDGYFFSKSTNYQWEIKTCIDDYGLDCKDYGQSWLFTTAETALPIAPQLYPINDPTGKKPVGLPLIIQWEKKPGMNSYYYEVTPTAGGSIITGKNTVSKSLPLNYPKLSLNTFYKWKVRSCWDYEAEDCEPDFSEEWTFKTTGQAPNLTYPTSGGQNIVIPVNFNWEDMPGAKSYVLKVDGLIEEKILNKSEFSIDFPEYPISQETSYSWQVKTCAWDEGKTCGPYSNPQSFKTFRLPPPQKDFFPGNNSQLFTGDKYISWEDVPGSKAYQYQIKYASLATEEIDETCSALVGKDLFAQPETTLTSSVFVELKCLGQYQWQVRSCMDNSCQEVSNWSTNLSFTLLEGEGAGQGGLIPCGRSTDNPKTIYWNERDSCEIKHIFLLIKIIIDFLLFRVAPIILVLLTILTGLIFYTSLGQITTITQVKDLWKAAGIGLALIFFAWTIVNVFLKVSGFNIGVFGNWYQLPI